jgi:hypothetical protein
MLRGTDRPFSHLAISQLEDIEPARQRRWRRSPRTADRFKSRITVAGSILR